MEISVTEIREKLTPLLCWAKLGINHCDDPRCEKAWREIQEWVENLSIIENNEDKLRIMGEHKDWTGKP